MRLQHLPFARAYYFAFYVIERYVDRFSGLWSCVRYLCSQRPQP